MTVAVEMGPPAQTAHGGGARRRRRFNWAELLPALVIVVVWDLVTRTRLVPDVVLAPPVAVFTALLELVQLPWFPEQLWTTALETVGGFVLAAVIGIPLGLMIASFTVVRRLVLPYVVVLQAIPKIALAPLFITWLGAEMSSKVALGGAIALFPVVINTILGVSSVDENARLLLRSLESSRWQILVKLVLPTSAPAILAGLETALTFALVGVIAAEFVAAQAGLGLLLITYNYEFRMPMVFAVMLVTSGVGLSLFYLVTWVLGTLIRRRPDIGHVY